MRAYIALLFVSAVLADVYMQNPRGSNNRLYDNDDNNQVDNANRLFDSQNNNAGGYEVGETIDGYHDRMYYYEGSQLTVEWTNQHGCDPLSGLNTNTHCEILLQYMCDPLVRDGTTTTQIDENEDMNFDKGMHENFDYYDACRTRERNKGLFMADREIVENIGNDAMYTRQNNNANERGYECSEERDYYPYWHPTPWKDIAVLTSTPDRCTYYQSESQNVKGKHYCEKPYHEFNNEEDCPDGHWMEEPAWGIPAPECGPAPWSRDNHLGNSVDGYMTHYNWTIPPAAENDGYCVLRLRYNMSTSDYDGWSYDASFNYPNSPIIQDPYVDWNWPEQALSLALNTNQFGRTFQDRSHSFTISSNATLAYCNKIWNLNVRGKRGTLYQTYPAVQYDFVPNRLVVEVGDCVHWQWTGSDDNDEDLWGEGRDGTDRSNVCQIGSLRDNYCLPDDEVTMWEGDVDQRTRFAHLNQQGCKSLESLLQEYYDPGTGMADIEEVYEDEFNCAKLNAAGAYFDGGIIQYTQPGVYFYMSTRNNVIGYQTQKATLVVEDPTAPSAQ